MRELSFRIYLTDAVRLAAENTARIGGGRYPRDRWADSLSRDADRLAGDPRPAADEYEAALACLRERAGIRVRSRQHAGDEAGTGEGTGAGGKDGET